MAVPDLQGGSYQKPHFSGALVLETLLGGEDFSFQDLEEERSSRLDDCTKPEPLLGISQTVCVSAAILKALRSGTGRAGPLVLLGHGGRESGGG